MNKKYVELFRDLAQAIAVTAEQVMEYDRSKEDEKGLETATLMRDDYQALHDRIEEAGDNYTLTKSDAAKLLVGAMIQTNQLQDRMNNLKKAMAGYQSDVIPKLQEMVDAENDEVVATLANEKFIIEDNK